ncbi:hypothetical protein MES5069_670004 [Mesorhizobium escarrei]|uniref:Alanine dehydrogenase/pyridine nucleotide transhydrogenase NAD(H)-binding domain-containing protein n=1 Tax=Mesorhizobium escarrei TaxID=666018 RepID=A0ABM9EFW4_9HYPH|nr:hypothetical protein MES5069_670004 [Mesorhizobium escarrei]
MLVTSAVTALDYDATALLRRAEVKVEVCMPGSLRSKGGGAVSSSSTGMCASSIPSTPRWAAPYARNWLSTWVRNVMRLAT